MSEVFGDSHYFIALWNRRDQFHDAAQECSLAVVSNVVTTHWVLVEVADALRDPSIRQSTHRFIHSLMSRNDVTVASDWTWFEAGLRLYGDRADKSWSLTDCISFAVMEARGIREALTGDHHFEQAGFVCLMRKPK
jgi:uncharacterized protein